MLRYPRMKYRTGDLARTVHSAEEEAALGPGWADQWPRETPAEPGPAPAPAVPDAPEPPAPAAATPAAPETDAARVYATRAADLIALVATADDVAALRELHALERAHPLYAGGRRGLLKAIEARLGALGPAKE